MNIIITGSSKGIGRSLTLKLSKNRPHNILGISRNKEKLDNLSKEINQPGVPSSFHSFPFDLNELETSQTTFFKTINRHFDHVDVLINNAGYLVNKSFESISDEEIHNSLSVNFIAPLLATRILLPLLSKSRNAHVVNIGSMGAVQGSSKFSGLSIYSASKAALAGLTEVLAEEWKNRSIRFNFLALGAVQTEMLEEAFPGYKARLSAKEIADYITDFALTGWKYYNGKILPVAVNTP